jgi:hypothetical protein
MTAWMDGCRQLLDPLSLDNGIAAKYRQAALVHEQSRARATGLWHSWQESWRQDGTAQITFWLRLSVTSVMSLLSPRNPLGHTGAGETTPPVPCLLGGKCVLGNAYMLSRLPQQPVTRYGQQYCT